MKLKRYSYMMLIFLVCMISISAISAADGPSIATDDANKIINDNNNQELVLEENGLSTNTILKEKLSNTALEDKLSTNTALEEKLSTNAVLEESDLSIASLEDKLSANTSLEDKNYNIEKPQLKENSPGTFLDLNYLINEDETTSHNTTITLDRDYIGGELCIKIDRPLLIDGQGHTLNASRKNRFFHITSENVILKNITFTNGNSTDYGGALYWQGDNGKIINCNFIDNIAKKYGGAIFWGDDEYEYTADQTIAKNGIIINSNFISNKVNIEKAEVWENGGGGEGGAVYWYANNGTICNSYFYNNCANGQGGAITWKGNNGTICNNTKFTANSVGDSGGAIFWRGDNGTIRDNCEFNNNLAYGLSSDSISKGGGAIFSHGQDINISNCSFMDNNVSCEKQLDKGGGAIYAEIYASISDCLFIRNSAGYYGGAIHLFRSGDVYRNIFINNSAEYGKTIVLRGMGHANIINNIILNKTSAIYWNESAYTIEANWFGNNATEYSDPYEYSQTWLFLNATANPYPAPFNSPTEVRFKLWLYNKNSKKVTEYDNSLLPSIQLSLSPTKGSINKETAGLDEPINYTANSIGTGSLSGKMEWITDSIFFEIANDPKLELSLDSSEINYGDKIILHLGYADGATGTVNINFKGNAHEKTIESIPLNKTITITESLLPDEYVVTAFYSGDSQFSSATKTADGKLKIDSKDPNMTVTSYDLYANDTNGVMFSIKLDKDATGKIFITEDMEREINLTEGTIKDGKRIIEIRNNNYELGNYYVAFRYPGDGIFSGFETTATSKIKVIETKITPQKKEISLMIGEKSKINYTISPSNAVGDVTFTSNDTSVIKINKNGNIEAIAKGQATITIKFSGSKNYAPSNASVMVMAGKENAVLTAQNITVTYNAEGYLKATLKNSENKSISGAILTVDLANKKNYTTDSNGEIKVPTKSLAAGDYTAKIVFEGNANYLQANTTAKVTIKKDSPKLTANNISNIYNTTDYLIVSLKDNKSRAISGAELTVYLNGTRTYKTDSKGQIKIPTKDLLPTRYVAKINFAGNKNYTEASASASIIISKIDTSINATDVSTTYNVNKDITVSLKDVAGNPLSGLKISVDLDGVKNYTTDSNGQAKVPTINVTAKTYNAKISFEGNPIYNASSTTAKVTIDKESSKISATNVSTKYGVNKNMLVTLKDSKGNPIRGAKVSVVIDKKKDYTTDSNGQVNVSTKDVIPGNYKATVTFAGNDNYTSSSISASVVIKRIKTSLNYTDMNTIAFDSKIEGRIGENFNFQLLDENGKPISGKMMFIGFNGVKYNRTSNETGWAKLQINLKYANHYTFAIAFLGDDYYSGSFSVALISVSEQTPSLTAESKTYKASAKTKELTATLKSYKGTAIPGKRITFTVNGKLYSANTNSNGIATVKVSLNQKGTYSFTAQYAGDSTYKKISKSGKLTIK